MNFGEIFDFSNLEGVVNYADLPCFFWFQGIWRSNSNSSGCLGGGSPIFPYGFLQVKIAQVSSLAARIAKQLFANQRSLTVRASRHPFFLRKIDFLLKKSYQSYHAWKQFEFLNGDVKETKHPAGLAKFCSGYWHWQKGTSQPQHRLK